MNFGVQPTELVRVTIVPQHTIVCDGCGYPMRSEGDYVKGTDGIHFACRTANCEQEGRLVFVPYERISIASAGRRER